MNQQTPKELGALASIALLAVQALFVALIVITDASYWVDEFGTVRIADVESLSAWWQQFSTWFDSDIQMPFYHFYMFLWGKAFGLSEYAFRMSNLPLFLLAECALLLTFRRNRLLALSVFFVSTFHPLVWYYLNEARPYVMLYLAATWSLCGLVSLYSQTRPRSELATAAISDHSPWLLASGILLLAGTSLLGVPWAGATLLAAGYVYATGRDGMAGLLAAWRPYAVLTFGLMTLGAFYLYTLLRGARATELFETDIRTLIFACYELLGLSGLGPGRLELRADGVAALQGWLPYLATGASLLALGVVFGLRCLYVRLGRRDSVIAVVTLALPAVTIAVVGFAMHWRVVGRHFMPALPALIMLLALGIAALYRSYGSAFAARGFAGLVLASLVVSGVSMHSPRHANADFRGAVEISKQALASPGEVWWAGYRLGALHYGITFKSRRESGTNCPIIEGSNATRAVLVNNLQPECLAELPRPDLIVLSDPQLYDRRGAVRDWIDSNGFLRRYAVSGFVIYRPDNQDEIG